jgi:hypothetical protein
MIVCQVLFFQSLSHLLPRGGGRVREGPQKREKGGVNLDL